jgi:iron complex outermembrane receptor protein
MWIICLSILAILLCNPSIIFAQSAKVDSTKNSAMVIRDSFPVIRDTFTAHFTDNIIAREADFKEIPSIVSQFPGIYSYSRSGLGFGYSFANILGFDQRRQSIFINGIPQNDPEDINVYWTRIPDLMINASEIQIFNGASYPYFSMAGAINIETASNFKEFNVSAGYGDYNTSKLAVTLNSGPIDDKYYVSARLSQLKSDGYRDASSIDEKSFSVSVERRDSNFKLRLNFYGGSIDDGLNYYGIFPGENNDRSNFTDPILRKINWSESFTYERRPQEHEEFFQPHYEAITAWDINRNTTFYNTLFYIKGDGFNDYDGTAPFLSKLSNSDYYRLTPVYGLRYNFTGVTDSSLGNELVRGSVSTNQFGWLPKLELIHSQGRGTFDIGGQIRFENSEHWGQLLSADKLPIGLPGDYHFYDYKGAKNIISGDLSEKYDFNEGFTASAGIQLLSQEYKFFAEKPFFLDSSGAALRGQAQTGWTSYAFNVPFFFVNPRIGIEMAFNDFLTGFVNSSITTREPRLKDYYNPEFFNLPNFAHNTDGSFNFNNPTIEPEHLYNIEIGTRLGKYLIDDNILFSGGIVIYYMPITEELLQTGITDQWGSPLVANAGIVDHFGIIVDGAFEFGTSVTLKFNFTASHNEIREFSQYSDSISVVGKVPVGFPSIIAGASLLLKPLSGLTFSLTERYIGAMYGDLLNSDQFRNDPYGVLDATLSYRQKNILGLQYAELRIEVNNLLNTFYTSYVESGTGFFVAATRHGFATIQIGL